MQLGLSQSLFSSHDVDAGSAVLLASVADRLAWGDIGSITDVGCGVGTLGLTAAASAPCVVQMYDRDALALAISAANAEANSVAVQVHGALGSRSEVITGVRRPPPSCDLVLCNLPAKAGAPVRQALIRDCASMLTGGGVLALVVVAPLHAETEATLSSLPGELWQRRNPGHVIFHYHTNRNCGDKGDPQREEPLVAYVRSEAPRMLAGNSLVMRSVFGLPNFDTSSYLTQLLASLLAARPATEWACWRRIWLWNPGQGDLATWLLDRRREQTSGAGPQITVASRDALQIHATERNVVARGGGLYASIHAPSPASAVEAFVTAAGVAGGVDLLVVPVEQDIVRTEGEVLFSSLSQALAPTGHLVVGGKSALVRQVLQRRQAAGGLTLLKQMRRKGQAAAICLRSS